MFFALSKILWFFVKPSSAALILVLAAIALTWTGWHKLGRNILGFAVLAGVILFFVPLGEMLVGHLEQRFPRVVDPPKRIDGIVVLGGVIDPIASAAQGRPVVNQAIERLKAAADLGKRYPAAKIVFSGGSWGLTKTEIKEAQFVVQVFEQFGLQRGRVLLEDKGRNTYENAIYSFDRARPKNRENWLLITSAFHMPRSVGSFRRAGWKIRAYPVDFRRMSAGRPWHEVRMTDRLDYLDLAVHEFLGLLVYYLTDKSNSLLPGPSPRQSESALGYSVAQGHDAR